MTEMDELRKQVERIAQHAQQIDLTTRQISDGGTWLTALHADVQRARDALASFTAEVQTLRAEVHAMREVAGGCPLAERLGLTP